MIPKELTEGLSVPMKMIVLCSIATTAEESQQLADYFMERARIMASPVPVSGLAAYYRNKE